MDKFCGVVLLFMDKFIPFIIVIKNGTSHRMMRTLHNIL